MYQKFGVSTTLSLNRKNKKNETIKVGWKQRRKRKEKDRGTEKNLLVHLKLWL